MNIGIVTTWFERGAAYVSRQFEQILQKEHDVYIYARGGEKYAKGDPNWDYNNVTWGTRIRTPFIPTVICKKNFIKWLKSYKIELVIFNEQHWFQPILWCKELGIKTVAYIDYYTEDTVPLFAAYDALICNTKRHMEAFKWHPGAFYVPWGTDINLYNKGKDGLVNPGVVTFFHSAGMTGERKGTDIFIKALWNIKQKSFKSIIHTQKSIENQFPELKDIIEELLSSGKLEIINKTISAPGLYHFGDVYIYPSRLEGIGLTIAEAISSGLACVVPNNGPMNEFVDSTFGELIDIENFYSRADGYYWPKCNSSVDSLVQILLGYINNPLKVINHKRNARNYAINKLSFEKNFNMLLSLIHSVNYIALVDELIAKINKYDTCGLKRFLPLFIELKLYKFLK